MVDTPPSPPPAFASLYRRNFESVHRCLARLGVPSAELDDAVQDVFVTAFRRRADYTSSRGSQRAWLLGISRRVAFRYRRSQARRARKAAALAAQPQVRGDLERAVAARAAEQALREFLQELDEDKRAAFVLGELEGLNRRELGRALGVNPNTAYSRLRAARGAFQTAFPGADEGARIRGARPLEADAAEARQRRVWLALAPLTRRPEGASVSPASRGGWAQREVSRNLVAFTLTVAIGGGGAALVERWRRADSPREPVINTHREHVVRDMSSGSPTPPARDRVDEGVAELAGARGARARGPRREVAAFSSPATKLSEPRSPGERAREASGGGSPAPPPDPLAVELAGLLEAQRDVQAARYDAALARLDQLDREQPEGAMHHERSVLRAIATCHLAEGAGARARARQALERLTSERAIAPWIARALAACGARQQTKRGT